MESKKASFSPHAPLSNLRKAIVTKISDEVTLKLYCRLFGKLDQVFATVQRISWELEDVFEEDIFE